MSQFNALTFHEQVQWIAYHRIKKKEREEIRQELAKSKLFAAVSQALEFFGIR